MTACHSTVHAASAASTHAASVPDSVAAACVPRVPQLPVSVKPDHRMQYCILMLLCW